MPSVIDKVLERPTANRLYSFLEKGSHIITPLLVFIEIFNHLCSDLLADKTTQKIDKGSYACGIFVDFQKAFSTIDHHILLIELQH